VPIHATPEVLRTVERRGGPQLHHPFTLPAFNVVDALSDGRVGTLDQVGRTQPAFEMAAATQRVDGEHFFQAIERAGDLEFRNFFRSFCGANSTQKPRPMRLRFAPTFQLSCAL